MTRPTKNELTYDILDTVNSMKNKIIALKEKQRQMKIGELWQEIIGNYKSFVNLKVGHHTGLDIISYDRKIAIELKNRTNTDNHSSKKSNMDKLADFKKKNPDYTCIYATINADSESHTMKGSLKKCIHNDVEILHYTGMKLLELIFTEHTLQILDFVRSTLDKYS